MFQDIITYTIVALAVAYAIRRVVDDLKRTDRNSCYSSCNACKMKKDLLTKIQKPKQTQQLSKKSTYNIHRKS